jgi:hypothetical protein
VEDGCKLFESLDLLVSERQKGSSRMWMEEGVNEVFGCALGRVSRGKRREHCFCGEKFHSVGYAGCVGFGDIYCVASVMVKCWCDVPSWDAMGGPGGTVCWFGVQDTFRTGGCHQCPIEVEVAVELAIG